MGQKQTKAQRIAKLEKQLAGAHDEIMKWDEIQSRTARDLRATRADLNRYREQERHEKFLADRKKRDAEREAERKRLDDLANGIIDLSKIKHDLGFDYDHDTDGGTVTITLHASHREAKILNAYATQDRRDPAPVFDDVRRNVIDYAGLTSSIIKGFQNPFRVDGIRV